MADKLWRIRVTEDGYQFLPGEDKQFGDLSRSLMGKDCQIMLRKEPRRRVLYVRISEDEHARVVQLAEREGVTLSNLLRRGLSELLAQEGSDPLVEATMGRGDRG